MIEDEESIQYALMEVINALMRNTIDVKRASLIIRALHIAVKNAARVKFGIHAKDTVTQVLEYPAPTPEHATIAQQSELPAVSAIPYKPVDPGDRHFWEYQKEGARILAREAEAASSTDRVDTGAFGRPAQAKPSASVGTDALVRPERSEGERANARHDHDRRRRISIGRSPSAGFQKIAARPTKRISSIPISTPSNPVSPQAPCNRKTTPQERKNAAAGARRG